MCHRLTVNKNQNENKVTFLYLLMKTENKNNKVKTSQTFLFWNIDVNTNGFSYTLISTVMFLFHNAFGSFVLYFFFDRIELERIDFKKYIRVKKINLYLVVVF